MKRSMTATIREVGPRLALRIARHGLDDHVLDSGPWYDTDDVCEDEAIFVGGCGRSGTTVLREVLSRHTRIACGPESHIMSGLINVKRLAGAWNLDRAELQRRREESSSVVRFAEAFFRDYAARQGKARWADKSPGNVRVVHRLLSRFPKARFVHILRDGRDVVCSLRHHPAQKVVDGKVIQRQVENPIERCARRWIRDVSAGVVFRGHPRYMEVRYEDLVGRPEPTVRELCAFLGEGFEPEMLDQGTDAAREAEPGRWLNNTNASGEIKGRMERWRRDLKPEERRTFVRIAGELLVAVGYAPDHGWVDDPWLGEGAVA